LGVLGKPELAEKSKTEISKDVSAMANSAGGIIIYGIAEDKDEPHPAVALSPIDPKTFSKGWLEQVINSRIIPRIQGLFIRPIQLSNIHPGQVAYIVSVPQSSTAHQAYDKRYYKRSNFQVLAMEHYEIVQTLNRRTKPTYEVDIDYYPVTYESQPGLKFRIIVNNPSQISGHDVSVVALVPDMLVAGEKHKAFGPVDIDGVSYFGMPGAFGGTISPLTSHRILLDNFVVVLRSPPPSRRFPVVVRLFDEYGQALETKFFFAYPDGKLVATETKMRETL
jgi:hypothetical protein